mmetsp:Transcript_13558/g.32385  ORF Transcript_13558/g.32385 Transcript_13558/m.32385 type:complete len:211 (-) Transcript_13558:892-1524(-)
MDVASLHGSSKRQFASSPARGALLDRSLAQLRRRGRRQFSRRPKELGVGSAAGFLPPEDLGGLPQGSGNGRRQLHRTCQVCCHADADQCSTQWWAALASATEGQMDGLCGGPQQTCAAFGRLCPHGISDMDGDRHGVFDHVQNAGIVDPVHWHRSCLCRGLQPECLDWTLRPAHYSHGSLPALRLPFRSYALRVRCHRSHRCCNLCWYER